jgi:hypothetical protein
MVPGVFQWCSHTGDCPQKELAKYDYSPEPCFFFFSFYIKILLQFNQKQKNKNRLIYAREKKSPEISHFLCWKMVKSQEEKKHWYSRDKSRKL